MSMRYGAVELSLPPGFQNILRLISHEVLRVKPEKNHEFIAGFIDDLLNIREASGYDPVTQGEMVDRVQEQYWKLQGMKRESEAKSANFDPRKMADNVTDPFDGSGDTGDQTSVGNDAEALVTIAMCEEEEMQQKEKDQPIDDVIEEEMVSEQPPLAEPQQEASISDEGGMERAEEGQNDDATEAVTTATEEDGE